MSEKKPLQQQRDEVIPLVSFGTGGRPLTVLGVISAIQKYYAVEVTGSRVDPCGRVEGNELPDEIFDIQQSLNFFNIGFTHGFVESAIFVLITAVVLPFLDNSGLRDAVAKYLPLVQFKWFLYLLEYFPIIGSVAICTFLARYYVGKITRKAINAFLSGRVFSLLLKGMLIFTLLTFVYELLTPDRISSIASSPLWGNWGELIYYTLFDVRKQLIKTAYASLFVFTLAMLVPFVLVWGWSWYRCWSYKRSVEKVERGI